MDDNSPYAYLLFTHHFAETCAIAESDGEAIGFVVGFRPPALPRTLFVWQIAVEAAHRGRGVGVAMLAYLLDHMGEDVRYVEATVTPSNEASRTMFRALAKRVNAQYEEDTTPLFPAGMFPDRAHEKERPLRIGPIDVTSQEPVEPSRLTA